MTAVRVSSAEFLKAYGKISEVALREPVSITNHGRDRLVLLSAEEYERLKRNDRRAISLWDLSDEDIKALEVAEPPSEASEFDHEFKG